MPTSRRGIALLLCVLALMVVTSGCMVLPPSPEDLTDDPPKEEGAPAGQTESEAPAGTDEVVYFTFSGNDLAYHTAILNETPFYIDHENKTVTANATRSFEEEAGIQTRRGTDSLEFSGTYDPNGDLISGSLLVRTEGTASGGGSSDTTIYYEMFGQLEGSLEGDTWSGIVSGDKQFKQTWEGGELSPEESAGTIKWTFVSSSRTVY